MYKKTILKNGLRVLTYPRKHTHSVTVLVLVKAGTKFEEKRENGISHLLEHMFFKGTKKRPNPLDLAKEMDALGGTFNAFTLKDDTGYFVTVGYNDLKIAFEIVSDILLNSIFPEGELEKEKKVIIEEIKMREDSPISYINYLWEKLLYKDQPAGWNIAGTRETVSRMKREDLINYTDKFYRAKNIVIGIAGRINTREALSLVKYYFSGIKRGEGAKKRKVVEEQSKPEKLLFKKDTEQTQIILGVRAFNIFDKRRFVLAVLNNILGGGMSSRLFHEIREKRGLAYGVGSSVEFNPDTGYLATYTGVDHKKMNEVIGLILKEYKKMVKKTPSLAEITRAKKGMQRRERILLDTNHSFAAFFARQELLENRILTPEDRIRKIGRVKPFEIKEVAREIFKKEQLNLAVLSPLKQEVEKFKI